MNSATTYEIESNSLDGTLAVAAQIGKRLRGGEVIDLIGDLGSGKTAFVRGLAEGAESIDHVQSPSFTISRMYRSRRGIVLHHFDFHRLKDPGLLARSVKEVLEDPRAVVIVEWSDIIRGVLPAGHLAITITALSDDDRKFVLKASDRQHQLLIEGLSL